MTLNELFPNTYQVLMQYGEDFVVKYRQDLQDKDAIATGNLFRSVRYEVVAGSQAFELTLTLPDYSEWLEEGTRPHYPPRRAIEDWIRVKGIIPREDMQGRLPTQQQLTYLIQRKIGLEGTEGKHIFQDTYDLTKDDWLLRLDEALTADIENNITEILDNILK